METDTLTIGDVVVAVELSGSTTWGHLVLDRIYTITGVNEVGNLQVNGDRRGYIPWRFRRATDVEELAAKLEGMV